jgi:XisH protein
MNYEQALEEFEPERNLFLAIPLDAYNTLFTKRFIQKALQRHQIKLFVFDPENGVIVQWQK